MASRNVFTLYNNWANLSGRHNADRRRVAAGQEIFNNRTFTVTTPTGTIEATCSGCHNTPNVGSSSTFRFFDVGVSNAARRSPNVPLYTFRHKMTGERIQTTDPGRGVITGLWADMNRFKVPGLRGLASRPPFFHDGSAASIRDVVNHYNNQFGIGFSEDEKRALVAFLETL
jgi:cytochrome c peroxidase